MRIGRRPSSANEIAREVASRSASAHARPDAVRVARASSLGQPWMNVVVFAWTRLRAQSRRALSESTLQICRSRGDFAGDLVGGAGRRADSHRARLAREAMEQIRLAKARGLKVYGETCPNICS